MAKKTRKRSKNPHPKRTKAWKEWNRRSKASIKGHKARRLAKELIANRRREAALSKEPTKRKSIPGLRTQVDQRIAELEAEVEMLRYLATFVHAVDPEWLRADQSVALYPSKIRTFTDNTKEQLTDMYEVAESKGPDEVERLARWISDEFEVAIQEVYTFFMSP